MGRGTWLATVHSVTKSQIQLKRLSSLTLNTRLKNLDFRHRQYEVPTLRGKVVQRKDHGLFVYVSCVSCIGRQVFTTSATCVQSLPQFMLPTAYQPIFNSTWALSLSDLTSPARHTEMLNAQTSK